nr:immunoglobulin mu heavy chain 2 [Protopterus dolloi]
MLSVQVLCYLLSCFSGCSASIVLTQKETEIGTPGASITLQCAVSGYNINDHHMHWIRQNPGTAQMEWLAAFMTGQTTYISPAVKDRVSPSTSGSTAQLQIRQLRPEDTAVYYCARWCLDYWGQGTTVIVTQAPKAFPAVFTVSACGELNPEGFVTLGCLATDYLPGDLKFTWRSEPSISESKFVQTTYPSVLSNKGTYTGSSQLQLPYSSCQENVKVICEVKHSEGITDFNVLCPDTTTIPPKVFILPPVTEEFTSGCGQSPSATLVCLVECLRPRNAEIIWYKNNEQIHSGVITHSATKGEDGNFTTSSQLTVTLDNWKRDNIFTCSASHSKWTVSKNISRSEIQCSFEDVKVYGIPPSIEDILLAQSATLSCLVSGLATPDSCNISWARGSESTELKYELDSPTVNSNGTFSVISTSSVCPADWKSGEEFTCIVEHVSFPSPKRIVMKKENGGLVKKPQIFLLPPASEDLSTGRTATVTCFVKGFYPEDIFIKWHHNGEPVPEHEYSHTNQIREDGNQSFSKYSKFNINVDDWNKGNSYTCIVGHESLDMNISSKTIDKSTGKPTSVNVTLILFETDGTCH